jgi:hypothetical protein
MKKVHTTLKENDCAEVNAPTALLHYLIPARQTLFLKHQPNHKLANYSLHVLIKRKNNLNVSW